MGSTSDFDGLYRIDNVDPGKYTLMISYIGYKSQEIELYISEFEIQMMRKIQKVVFPLN